MLYELLTRTYLWLYWFVEYHSLEEDEYGCGDIVDGQELRFWLEDVLSINSFDLDYCRYTKF